MAGRDPLLRFGNYEPDTTDYESDQAGDLANVVPRGDGYGPVQDRQAFTQALVAANRGFFYARKSDGSVLTFVGTSTKLYELNNSTFGWTDVSLGAGTYSALSAGANWQFAQVGNLVFATQANVVLQVFDMSSSTAFANNAGSPPQAAYIAVVGQFLVLSGLLSTPYRIQWSSISDTTAWVNGVNQADFQDFADGGLCRGVAGGEYGVIFQDVSIRQMTYAPGSVYIFQITRITEDMGLAAPFSIIRSGPDILFYAAQGFQKLTPGSLPQPIGKEKVDRTFAADLDIANLQLFIGANDPNSSRVYWAYKSLSNGSAGQFDKMLSYDKILDRWAPIVSLAGQYLASLAKPGVTLENLDIIATTTIAITNAVNNGAGLIRLTVATINLPVMVPAADGAPQPTQLVTGAIIDVWNVGGVTNANAEGWVITVINATTIDLQGSTFAGVYTSGGIIAGPLDAMAASLDSYPAASSPEIAVFGPDSKLGFLDGPNLEARLESAEKGDFGTRIFISGFRPATDATTCFGSLSSRERLQDTRLYSAEQPLTSQGLIPARLSTRYSRARLRIPYGAPWTFAEGIEPEIDTDGER